MQTAAVCGDGDAGQPTAGSDVPATHRQTYRQGECVGGGGTEVGMCISVMAEVAEVVGQVEGAA